MKYMEDCLCAIEADRIVKWHPRCPRHPPVIERDCTCDLDSPARAGSHLDSCRFWKETKRRIEEQDAAFVANRRKDTAEALVKLQRVSELLIECTGAFPEFVGERYVEDALLEECVREYREGLTQARMSLDKLVAYAKTEAGQ